MMDILLLSNAPKSNHSYIWGDYLELHCLQSKDNIASIDVAAKETKSHQDNGLDAMLYENDDGIDFNAPENMDDSLRYAEEGLRNCSYREKTLGDHYPFHVDMEEKELYLKDPLSSSMHLYLSLLLCANHSYCVPKSDVFTTGFEVISKFAFKGMLPPEAKVLHLGTRQQNNADCLVCNSNKTIDKIEAIASKLNLPMIAAEQEFSARSTGDAGVDLIGYIPLNEGSMPEELVFFGQSATTKDRDDIKNKQNDCSSRKWCQWIKFKVANGNFLFIAASLRTVTGDFVHGLYRDSDAVIVDRTRIMKFIVNWLNRTKEAHAEEIIPDDIQDCVTKLVA